jgi:hypothetical protein
MLVRKASLLLVSGLHRCLCCTAGVRKWHVTTYRTAARLRSQTEHSGHEEYASRYRTRRPSGPTIKQQLLEKLSAKFDLMVCLE